MSTLAYRWRSGARSVCLGAALWLSATSPAQTAALNLTSEQLQRQAALYAAREARDPVRALAALASAYPVARSAAPVAVPGAPNAASVAEPVAAPVASPDTAPTAAPVAASVSAPTASKPASTALRPATKTSRAPHRRPPRQPVVVPRERAQPTVRDSEPPQRVDDAQRHAAERARLYAAAMAQVHAFERAQAQASAAASAAPRPELTIEQIIEASALSEAGQPGIVALPSAASPPPTREAATAMAPPPAIAPIYAERLSPIPPPRRAGALSAQRIEVTTPLIPSPARPVVLPGPEIVAPQRPAALDLRLAALAPNERAASADAAMRASVSDISPANSLRDERDMGQMPAAAGDVASLGQLYADLLVLHPEIQAARANVEGSAFGKDAARAGYLPKISVGSTLGRDRYSGGADSVTVNRHNMDLIVRQNLYTGGKLEAQGRIASIDETHQKNALRVVTQRVLLDAIAAQLQVQRTALLLAIARSSEHATADLAKLEERREKLGGTGFTDVSFARTRLLLAQERTRQFEISAEEARNTFRQLFGRDVDPDALPDLSASSRQVPSSLQEAIDQAIERNPELRTGEIQHQRALQQLKLEESQAWPTAELVATRRLVGESTGVSGLTNDNTIGVRLAYAVYSGGELKARAGMAATQVQATQRNADASRRRIEDNVRTLWARTSGAAGRIEALETASDDARRTFLSRAKLREFGRETALAVLDSQLEYNNVLVGLVNATFDRRVNGMRLLGATGALPLDMGSIDQLAEFVDTQSTTAQLKQRIERLRSRPGNGNGN